MESINKEAWAEDLLNRDLNNQLKYDLVGVINHYGNQYFGHYTAKVFK